jgi:hypothetical protein
VTRSEAAATRGDVGRHLPPPPRRLGRSLDVEKELRKIRSFREGKRLKKLVSSVFGAFGAAAEASPSPFFRRDRARF